MNGTVSKNFTPVYNYWEEKKAKLRHEMNEKLRNYAPPISSYIYPKHKVEVLECASSIINSIEKESTLEMFRERCFKFPSYALMHVVRGRAAIHQAAYVGNETVANYILNRSPHFANCSRGWGTPLIYALENLEEVSAISMTKLIISKGADVNFKITFKGRHLLMEHSTPLIMAARRGFSSLVNILLKSGAKYSLSDCRSLNIKTCILEKFQVLPDAAFDLEEFSYLLDDRSLVGLNRAIQIIYQETKNLVFTTWKQLWLGAQDQKSTIHELPQDIINEVSGAQFLTYRYA